MTATPVFVDGWRLDKILGTGGFGIVELWVHTSDKKLAIKKCKWDIEHLSDSQQKRWVKEVKIMEHLKHKNIIKVLELPFRYPKEKIKLPILCMEFCRKGDLRKVLNNIENCCGISEKEAINVMKDISSAVEYLHSKNITHRDLKPENIVLQDEHDNISYKLIDLGYAKELGETSISASIVGTLNYVAPELLWKQKYSCSVDYWSLGILFYELVTGTRPFFPRMQHTIMWMQYIKDKSNNDICAFESKGKVVFSENITDLTKLSRCLRNKLVEWFRVVLQWDPSKRGKQCDENGEMQLVVFKLLNTILSKQIVYVFSASRYKLNAYEVDDSTTVMDIQSMIEKDDNIPINQQILTNYLGTVLITNGTSLLSQISKLIIAYKDPVIFIFESGSTLMENTRVPDIPISIQKMIELSRDELDFDTLKDYYRAAIFFTSQEVHLFQLYIFALSIKVDLLVTRLNIFDENITDALTSINALLRELSIIRPEWKRKFANKEKMEALEIKFEKITKLAKAIDQIKLRFNPLIRESNELKSKAESVDCVTNVSQLYDKAVQIFEQCKNEKSHKCARPTEMVKLIFEFLKVLEEQFNNENISEMIKCMAKLEVELLTLERIFDSVTVMMTVYREEFQNITKCTFSNIPNISNKEAYLNTSIAVHNEMPTTLGNNDIKMSNESTDKQFSNAPVVTPNKITDGENDLIYDNLVLRHTLDHLVIGLQKKCMEVVSLEL